MFRAEQRPFDEAAEQRRRSRNSAEDRLASEIGTGKLANMVTKELLEKKLREQTGLFFAAWGILLVSSIALWFR